MHYLEEHIVTYCYIQQLEFKDDSVSCEEKKVIETCTNFTSCFTAQIALSFLLLLKLDELPNLFTMFSISGIY